MCEKSGVHPQLCSKIHKTLLVQFYLPTNFKKLFFKTLMLQIQRLILIPSHLRPTSCNCWNGTCLILTYSQVKHWNINFESMMTFRSGSGGTQVHQIKYDLIAGTWRISIMGSLMNTHDPFSMQHILFSPSLLSQYRTDSGSYMFKVLFSAQVKVFK